jgi:hypothetical protein
MIVANSSLGIFVLALDPNRHRYIPGLQRRVLRFAIPAGLLARITAYADHRVTRMLDPPPGSAPVVPPPR